MGEYVMEILVDLEAAMSPPVVDHLANFLSANLDYWQLTKQRIASYWNVYYRHRFNRSDYVGFRLARQLDARLCAARSPIKPWSRFNVCHVSLAPDENGVKAERWMIVKNHSGEPPVQIGPLYLTKQEADAKAARLKERLA